MTNAISSYGIALQIGDGATPTELFTEIAEVLALTPPAITSDTVETTPHSGAGWKQFAPTLFELGEFTARLSYLPANSQQQSIITDMLARTLRNFKIVFPDSGSSEWAFAAYITGFEVSEAPATGGGSALEATITLRPSQTAAPTFPS